MALSHSSRGVERPSSHLSRSGRFMAIQTPGTPQAPQRLHGFPMIPKREGRLYAITFDMDTESLKLHYGGPCNNAYGEIRKVMLKQGFGWTKGSIYIGA